jgi:hypothetical protein
MTRRPRGPATITGQLKYSKSGQIDDNFNKPIRFTPAFNSKKLRLNRHLKKKISTTFQAFEGILKLSFKNIFKSIYFEGIMSYDFYRSDMIRLKMYILEKSTTSFLLMTFSKKGKTNADVPLSLYLQDYIIPTTVLG